jgi:hypothetical protein
LLRIIFGLFIIPLKEVAAKTTSYSLVIRKIPRLYYDGLISAPKGISPSLASLKC